MHGDVPQQLCLLRFGHRGSAQRLSAEEIRFTQETERKNCVQCSATIRLQLKPKNLSTVILRKIFPSLTMSNTAR